MKRPSGRAVSSSVLGFVVVLAVLFSPAGASTQMAGPSSAEAALKAAVDARVALHLQRLRVALVAAR